VVGVKKKKKQEKKKDNLGLKWDKGIDEE